MATRICNKCGAEKPLSEFRKSPKGNYRNKCKVCTYQEKHRWNAENKTEIREYQNQYRREKPLLRLAGTYRQRYGITLERYDQMFIEQNGVCAICGEINYDGRRLSIDHNHKTGEVRGLLCGRCNFALGNVKEDISILYGLIRYLQKFNGAKDKNV